MTSLGRVSSEQSFKLAIGLPLRNREALTNLLQDLYNPASPNYHHFITPEEFTQRFGPSEADYAAVAAFAEANGLTVTTRHPNRTLLDVEGTVAIVEQALHVRINRYAHPTENRNFYAPDAEPSLALDVPVLGISGLSDYAQPKPRYQVLPLSNGESVSPNAGSGPFGGYMGNDFRAAYASNTVLTGAGQTVGLLQFDGYTASDITYYEALNSLPNVPLTNVLLDGFSGAPTHGGGEVEVSLDIEMAISMAPGLSQVILYEAGPNGNWHDILNRMATDNLARQLSCSWYSPGAGSDAVADQIWQQMAAQGQSFFNASGDYNAYSGLIDFPGDSPYITQVGGTMLTTSGPGGAYVSEAVWNRGNGIGSGGGISTQYAIPGWQTNISMAANFGSTTMRNTPDVALTAENVYVRADGADSRLGGTSCAAPLWAGFIALVNQQAAIVGQPAIGFFNPVADAFGVGLNYTNRFHDITTGNNGSGTHFPAVTGYDLATGWGTPNGQALIDAIAPPDTLVVSPAAGFSSSGAVGGPFSMSTLTFSLTNNSAGTITWSAGNIPTWLNASLTNGVLATNSGTNLTLSLNLVASNLPPGNYNADFTLTNQTSGFVHHRGFSLQTHDSLVITPATGFSSYGPVGGPFTVSSQFFTLSNSGLASLNWSFSNDATWLDVGPVGGVLSAGAITNVLVNLNVSSLSLPPALYTGNVLFSNATGGLTQNRQFTLQTGQLPLQNGGFEAGTFQGWTLSGNTNGMTVTSASPYFHGGFFGAKLGPHGALGHLSQALPTKPGHAYLISFWLENPSGGSGNEFTVSWNGASVFDQVNVGNVGWTNIQILVAALGTNGVLDFGVHNDTTFFGLDDVAVFETTGSTNPPVITTQPTNLTVTAGLTAAFAAAVSGIQPFYYQWQLGGTNVPGATNVTLLLSPVTTAEAGNYSLMVSNVFGSTNSSNALLTVMVPACDPPAPGLISWWAAEGNTQDSFGTNNGTLVGGAGFASGEAGQAFSFNGTNQYVQVPDSPSWNFGTNGFTIELWAKFSVVGGKQALVAHDEGTGKVNKWIYWLNNGQLQLEMYSSATGEIFIGSGAFSPTLNQWYHLCITRNGSMFSFYINGALSSTATNSVPLPTAFTPMTFGKAENQFYLGGGEDEISIYNRALAGNEIQAIYNAASTGKCISAPVIVFQPTNQVALAGSTATFIVAAGGTPQLQYQWLVNNAIISAETNASATNAALVLTNVQPGQSGNAYSVVVSNLLGSTNSSNALLTVTLPPPCDPPPSGLIGWWAGEGSAVDSFGTNNGALQGGATFAVGEVGQAFNFNGINQYVQVPDSSSWDFGSNAFTIELWINFSNVVAKQAVVAHDEGTGQLNKWIYWLNNGQLQVETYSTGTGEILVGSGSFNPVLNQWYHLCVTRNGSVFSFFTNGVLNSTSTNTITLANASAALTFGKAEDQFFLTGKEDEVTIYNRALSSNEVQAIYNSGISGKCQAPPVIALQPTNQTSFVGGAVAFAVSANGAQPLNYQWLVNGTNIPIATNSTATSVILVLTNVQLIQSGNIYSVLVSNLFGSTNSSNALLSVNLPPSCDPPPSGLVSWWGGEGNTADSFGTNNGTLQTGVGFGAGIVGQAFSFSGSSAVQVPDAPNLNYTSHSPMSIELWVYRTGTQSPMHILGKRNISCGALEYQMAFDATGGGLLFNSSVTDGVFTGLPLPPNVWMHLAATYDGTTFRFYTNGVLAGTGSGSLGPVNSAPLTIGQSGDCPGFAGLMDEVSLYNRALSAAEIQAIYNAGSVGKCQTPPSIVSQPTNQATVVGGTASFAVGAAGSQPLGYQWLLNGTNISTRTNATLVLTNVQLNQSGSIYSVVVRNLGGFTNSSNVLLTVNPPPPCDPPPSGLVSWWAAEGNAADSFGSNNGTLINGTAFVAGEVGQAFRFDGSSQYVQIPDNPSWNLGSQAYTIELWVKFDAVGGTRAFMAHDTGSGTVNKWIYWLNNGQLQMELYSSGTGEVMIGGGAFSPATNQWYHIAVTRNGSLFSFYTNGVLNASIANSTALPNATASLTLGNAENNFFLAGEEDEISVYNRALSGSEIQAIFAAGGGGKCHPPPIIVTQPTNQTVNAGGVASFSVGATGAQPLSYQWLLNGTNISAATNSTAATATLVLTDVQFNQSGGFYSVIVGNLGGLTNSSNALLTVNPPPPCDPAPSGLVSWWAGENNTLDNAGTNNGTGVNLTFASGEVGTAFNINGLGSYVDVPDSISLSPATAITVEAWIYPTGPMDPNAGIVNKDTSTSGYTMEYEAASGGVRFGVYANGHFALSPASSPPPSNTWSHLAGKYDGTNVSFYLNGTLVGSSPASGAIVASASHLQIGHTSIVPSRYYTGLIDEVSLYGRALSSAELAAIYAAGISGKCPIPVPPAITAQPTNLTVVLGSPANFSVTATGTAPLSFQWRFNNSNIFAGTNPTATNSTLVITNAQATNIGNYSVLVTNIAGFTNSSNALLALLFPPTITLNPASNSVQPGCTVVFNAAATGTGLLTYQWQKDGTNLTGQNGTNLTILNVQTTNFGGYAMIASNAYGAATSAVAVLSLDQSPIPGGTIVQRYPAGGIKINVSTLLTNATDPDGDPVSFVGINSTNSVAGGTVSLSGGVITYLPPAGYTNADAFTYTLSDGRCGGTAVGTVLVQVRADLNPASQITIMQMPDGSVQVLFNGIPGYAYRVQSATILTAPDWQDVATLTADAFGNYVYVDHPVTNGPVRFYRSVWP